MDHSTMADSTAAPVQPRTPIPELTPEDRIAAFPEVAGHAAHDHDRHSFWLIDRLFPAVRAHIGAGAGIDGVSDPAGLPIVVMIYAVLGLLATPLTNSMTRFEESDADRFSLENAHQPDGLAKALVKTIAYRASSPGRLEEILFYDHPSVERRVRRAMEWKAAHPDHVGAPYGPLPPGQ